MTRECFWVHKPVSGSNIARGAILSSLLLITACAASCASRQAARPDPGTHDWAGAAQTSARPSPEGLSPWEQASAPAAMANQSRSMSVQMTPDQEADDGANGHAGKQGAAELEDETPQAPDRNSTPYDPLSPLNQKILDFNVFFDDHVGRPAGTAWAWMVPYPARLHIRSFFRNTAEPKNLINCMLQSRYRDARITLERFSINSTLGVVGFFDVAQDWFGLPRKPTDFGLTEAHHSVTYGPYLMAPVGGPTSFRDAAGTAVDGQLNALVVLAYVVPSIALLPITAGLGLIAAVNERSLHLETFDDVNRYTVDLYGAVQDVYYQKRSHDEAPPGSE